MAKTGTECLFCPSTHSKSEKSTGIESTITSTGKYNKDLRASEDLMRDDNQF